MSDRAIRWLFPRSLAALTAWAVANVELSTDISRFMPGESDAELASLPSRLSDSELTRHDDPDGRRARPPTQRSPRRARFGERLRGDPEVASVRSGVDPDQLEEAYRLYFPRRHAFLSEDPERRSRSSRRPPRWPSARATCAPAWHCRPRPSPAPRGERSDGAFERLIGRLGSQRPPLDWFQGGFVTPDHQFAVPVPHHGPFGVDSEPQARLLAAIDGRIREIAAASPVSARAREERRETASPWRRGGHRRDVHWIVAVSSLGVAVVPGFLRSLRLLRARGAAAVSGIVAGTVVTRLVFGRIDGGDDVRSARA